MSESDEEAFFADSFSVLFNPKQFVFDFKQKVPRVENSDEGHEQRTMTSHTPVLMTPELAKRISKILEKNVEKYEKKFGEIELGEKDSGTSPDEEEPSYIG